MTLNRMSELLQSEYKRKRNMALLDEGNRPELLEVAEALRLATNLCDKIVAEMSSVNQTK